MASSPPVDRGVYASMVNAARSVKAEQSWATCEVVSIVVGDMTMH